MNETNTARMMVFNDCTRLHSMVSLYGTAEDSQHLRDALHTVVQDLARHNPDMAAAYKRFTEGAAPPPFAEVDAAKQGVEVQHG